MKKLLIILLFLGFSFGQDKTLIVGVWDCISCDDKYFRFVFKNDGTSVVTVTLEDGSIKTKKYKWENFKTDGNDFFEQGVLNIDFNVNILNYDYYFYDNELIEINNELETYLSQVKSDIKNDILILEDENQRKIIYEKK